MNKLEVTFSKKVKHISGTKHQTWLSYTRVYKGLVIPDVLRMVSLKSRSELTFKMALKDFNIFRVYLETSR